MKALKDIKKRLSKRLGRAMRGGRLTAEREAIDGKAARWWAGHEAPARLHRKTKRSMWPLLSDASAATVTQDR